MESGLFKNGLSCPQFVYAQVILPLKYKGEITYVVPEQMAALVDVGSRVRVDFAGRTYTAVVESLIMEAGAVESLYNLGLEKGIVYKEIIEVENLRRVSEFSIKLWHEIADYYLCTVGEVYKAAYSGMVQRQEQVKMRKRPSAFFESVKEFAFNLPQLSQAQQHAFDEICGHFETGKRPVLLHGITGSGKTEIYINLASRQLAQGKNVLYMVPEIALSKQLQERLRKVFGERLLVYHSKQTTAEKGRIYKIVSGEFKDEYLRGVESSGNEKNERVVPSDVEAPNDAVVVLGTRSSLFLPFKNLALVVVDEEHDSSYKQSEPTPRYHARDAAIILSGIYGADTLLGSATPSFEAEYNCRIGRFSKVFLFTKYYGAQPPEVEIIDTIWARRSGQMRGSFSQKLINEMKKTLQKGEQILVFKNRRSYSPVVECVECGTIPKCPCCNVYLSYHKYNNTLRCHYCDYTVKFNGICTKCGLDTLKYKGAGTEKIEEELKALFPEYSIARFDADIAESKREEEAVIKAFSKKEIDILVGTQMVSKGFDFEHLGLVAVLDADSILGIQDFRADERALQMFSQLMGRTGRREKRGKLLVQTNQKEHPVILELKNGTAGVATENITLIKSLLEERREFAFAPYVRMVKIVAKHKDKEKLELLCASIQAKLSSVPCKEFTGPFVPAIDKVRGEWLKCFYVKFSRDSRLVENKQKLLSAMADLKAHNSIVLDVDPL
ncbi:MAG: primosomal protein N' [Bacteroidales bacterium]|nr:primosomal protein N' [Bacteroidales bacterium]